MLNGTPVSQGDVLNFSENEVYNFVRYPDDYPAFNNRDLFSRGYLELNPDEAFCFHRLLQFMINLFYKARNFGQIRPNRRFVSRWTLPYKQSCPFTPCRVKRYASGRREPAIFQSSICRIASICWLWMASGRKNWSSSINRFKSLFAIRYTLCAVCFE